MSTVEFGNSLDPGEELDDLLDFPVDDCLEEGETVEDWDIANEQCLGPIPLDMLMAPPTTSNEELNSSILIPKPVAPIAGAPEQKQQLLEHVHSSNTIPVRSRSKRARHSGINPRLFAAHEQNSNARRSKESRESSLQKPVAMDLMRNSPEKDDNVSDPACETASKACPVVVKKCAHCQATKTPQWRRGPLGAMTLCNACGVSYRTGRLFPEYRPAASPTFISSQHSNSHRKVVGMRLEKRLKFKIKIPRVPADTSSSLQIARTPKPVDTPCSLVPRLIPGLPEQTHLAKNVHINGFPEQKQVDEHVDTYSTTRIRLQIAGTHKHVDSPCSFVPRLVAGAPEQKHPGKHVDTSCSLIPPPSKVGQARKQKQHIERKQLAKHDDDDDDDDTYRPPNKLAKKVQQESRGESSLKPESRQAGGKPPSLPCTKVRIIINVGKKCAHCQSTRIPQCGEGPLGPGMLCNACEVRYRSGRLLPQHRPEASP